MIFKSQTVGQFDIEISWLGNHNCQNGGRWKRTYICPIDRSFGALPRDYRSNPTSTAQTSLKMSFSVAVYFPSVLVRMCASGWSSWSTAAPRPLSFVSHWTVTSVSHWWYRWIGSVTTIALAERNVFNYMCVTPMSVCSLLRQLPYRLRGVREILNKLRGALYYWEASHQLSHISSFIHQ